VLAALEMGARLSSEPSAEAVFFRVPADAGRYLMPRYGHQPVETFGLLALDVRRRLRREVVISVGCLTSSLVHPREVFQAAVTSRAAGLILFHNHPSGDPEPSPDDLHLTAEAIAAGRLLDIALLDHVILAGDGYVSLRDRGVAFDRR
jgi:DNA repair protein RadC